MKFIIGRKQEMTQKFLDDGTFTPVTRIAAPPCVVIQKKDYGQGKRAVQIGREEIKIEKLKKALRGFFKKIFNKDIGYKQLKEFRLDNEPTFEKLEVGVALDVSMFKVGDKVDVQGISKGRGFQGVVKRHKFAGGKASHGHKDQLRMPGSIAAKGFGRVPKGTRMGGHMGDETVTIKNLEIIGVDEEKNELLVKGAVPGFRGAIVYIRGEGEFALKNVAVPQVGSESEIKDESVSDAKAEPVEEAKEIEQK